MKKLLIINSSTRVEGSYSRELTKLFVQKWTTNNPNDNYTYREVGITPIPHITADWIKAAFIKPQNRTVENQECLSLSNELVNELLHNDIFVIGVPMYNWSIPSSLKAYIDQVMRINETWKFKSGTPDGDYVGLLENKQVYILSSRGDNGYADGEHNAHMNFQTSYLKTIFNIMGVHNITIISLDNEEYGGELFEKSKQLIYQQIRELK